MNKTYFHHLFCLCFFCLLAACSDSEETFSDYLTPATGSEGAFNQGLSFTEGSSTQTVSFDAGNTWTATLKEANISDWCRVSPTQGNAGKNTISISVSQNSLEEPRTATLIISAGSVSKQVSITQAAKPYIAPDGLSWNPEKPDADQPVTLTFKATSKSGLYGYTGNVYVHIGVVSDSDWLYVPADWDKNIDKC